MNRAVGASAVSQRAQRKKKAAPEDRENQVDDNPRIVIVKPAANTIRILRYLSEAGGSARAIAIARHLSINASTCFNILRTLVLEEVVDFDPLSKTYSTGLGLSRLVGSLLTEGQRLQATVPLMRDLAAQFNVTVSLWKRLGEDRIVLVRCVPSPSDVRIEMAEGQRLPILMGATGRIMAGHSGFDKKALRSMFKTLRWQRPLSFEDYVAQVSEARGRGWAIDEGFYASGMRSCAVPIRDNMGDVIFSLSTAMFLGQHNDKTLERLGQAMIELAPKLSRILF